MTPDGWVGAGRDGQRPWKNEIRQVLQMEPDLDVEVLPHEHGLMIKEIIFGRLGLSRGLVRRIRRGGQVSLNGKPAFITQRVQAGDRIRITFSDEPTLIQPQPIKLDIVYEDQSLVAINKPAHMAVHPTATYPDSTLANGLAYHWQCQGLARKIRLLHRLDRDTSGLILVAKEPYAYQQLVKQLRNRSLKRTYLAIVNGRLENQQGVIDQPIGLSGQGHGLKRAVMAEGKPARTYYRVLAEYKHGSLLELELATGRTHQIRVHLAWMGHPIVGDQMYAGLNSAIYRQALHAWRLRFNHPRTNQPMELKAPLPEDMRTVLKAYQQ